ncbi:MAG: GNAT family N-acetyltransferase [Rhizobiales bacterium]|nr:GNAT family N-acetyltransferase [Hyphomicrobiales bacterium]
MRRMRAETDRLILRQWEDRDVDAFAAINADAEVMRFFPAPLTHEETVAYVERMRSFDDTGLGFRAVEEKATGDLVGVVGMAPVGPLMPVAPAIEIGWRLARRHWGKGYASEAARAWLAYGFGTMAFDEIIAFTFAGNLPSRRVMERLGMSYDPAVDFDHPALPAGHPLAPHVTYRLRRDDFRR